ncbi:sensor histidine kinase [Streptomyces sp. NPDC088785]|uniref:sensor histidine kinase n=1 Tax=Streptomyces sp. NPDC088785 TaxID=3365897 RepID=UPI003828AF7F
MPLISGFRPPVPPDGASSARPGRGRVLAETIGAAAASLLLLRCVLGLSDPPHPGFQLACVPIAAALLSLRWRLPLTVLTALAVLAGAAPVTGPVLAVAAYTVSLDTVRPRDRIRALVGGSLLVVATASATAVVLGPGRAAYGPAQGLVLAVTAVVVPGLIGTVAGQQARLLRALRERGDAAERARRSADGEARARERSRIAAEMHDLLGHRLSLVSLHAGGLEMALRRSAPELREEAVLVRRTTRDAMRDLRQALGVLGPLGRDTGPDALTEATGTRADVTALVAASRDGGVRVDLEWTGPDVDGCPAAVRRAVHRVVREALTNVHRYAPDASVAVRVAHGDGTVRVTVRNGPAATAPDGPDGPDGLGTGRGLTGLRERVGLLGGVLEAAPLPSGGFQVRATVPTAPDGTGTAPPGPPEPSAAAEDADAAEGTVSAGAGATALARTPRRTGHRVLALGAVALWVTMGAGIVMVYGLPRGVTPPPVPRPGMTYEQLKGVYDDPGTRAAATGREPSRPARTAGCVYRHGDPAGARDVLRIDRYCFDGSRRLLAIDHFTVPSVPDGPPWEAP